CRICSPDFISKVQREKTLWITCCWSNITREQGGIVCAEDGVRGCFLSHLLPHLLFDIEPFWNGFDNNVCVSDCLLKIIGGGDALNRITELFFARIREVTQIERSQILPPLIKV